MIRGPVHAADFGVTGDGTTNDWANLTTAINHAQTVGPRHVVLPHGTCNIGNNHLQIDRDLILRGESRASTITFTGPTGIRVGGNGHVTLRASIRDLTINGKSRGQHGIVLGDHTATPQTGSAVLTNIAITGCTTAAILSNQSAYLYLDNVDLHANPGIGLTTQGNLGQTTTIRAVGTRFQQNGKQGVLLRQSAAATFLACSFEANTREGFLHLIEPDATPPVNRTTWLTDCYFENNLTDGAPGGQLAWRSTNGQLLQQINVTRPHFSLTQPGTGQYNMLIGSGFATIDLPEQQSGTSKVENDPNVYLHVNDRYPPVPPKWNWSSTGLAKIAHHVWNGANQSLEQWCNSPTGPTQIYGADLNDGKQSWWGTPKASQQHASTIPELWAALKTYGLLDPTSTPPPDAQ